VYNYKFYISFIYLHIHILLYIEKESTMNELSSCEVSLNKGVGIVGGGKEVALDGMEATLRRRFHENNIFLGKMIAKNFLGKIIGGKVGRASLSEKLRDTVKGAHVLM
jgi:hypothetical protein